MKPLMLLLFTLSSLLATAQITRTDEVVYKEWAMLGESKTFIDVDYRVLKCGGLNQVHISIFNENPKDQEAHFIIEILGVEEQKISKEIRLPLKAALMYRPECKGDPALKSLKIDLPADFDPSKLTVKINFKS